LIFFVVPGVKNLAEVAGLLFCATLLGGEFMGLNDVREQALKNKLEPPLVAPNYIVDVER
jgi:hypothetical protein